MDTAIPYNHPDRMLDPVGPITQVSTGNPPIKPLAMRNSSLGGASWNYTSMGTADSNGNIPTSSGQLGVTNGVGVNNIGLLVTAFGKAVAMTDSTGMSLNTIEFQLQDGSTYSGSTIPDVRVMYPPGEYIPTNNEATIFLLNGDYVCVTGAMGTEHNANGSITPQIYIHDMTDVVDFTNPSANYQ